MTIAEKKLYLWNMLVDIGLLQEKMDMIRQEIDHKTEFELDEIIIKLEDYYTRQNILDQKFVRDLQRIDHQIDEAVDGTNEKIKVENLLFNF